MPRSEHRQKKPDTRLPAWTQLVIVAGGIAAYVGVGMFLLGNRFREIEGLWVDARVFFHQGSEVVAPYVLLLIPAVLGAFFTRDALRVIFRGLRKGDDPLIIAKDVGVYLLGSVVLVLLALFSRSPRSTF